MYDALRDALGSGDFPVVESFDLPPRSARYSAIPPFLNESRVGAQVARRHSRLWFHQAEALAALGRGENVVLSTGTASGKSLVFQAFALHQVSSRPSSRVIVFYPLKALAADQLQGWREIGESVGLSADAIGRIDGSVPPVERDGILQRARIIVMTPDVCHAWLTSRLSMPIVKTFVHALSVLVLDEAHTLDGVFGSNFAFLARRLVAARNHLLRGDDQAPPLRIVAATATISKPGEHLKRLTGREFSVIDEHADGAQRHERFVAHVASAEGEELQVVEEIQRRVLTAGGEGGFITFCDSRKGVEQLAIRSAMDEGNAGGDPAVLPYRAGYAAEDRQRIEALLKSGRLRGVVSTSALELGIDLPHLRVGLNVGVPATRKAYRQRLGRIGRRAPGAFVVVAAPDAFRRYGTSFQEYHEMSVEPSHLYLDNRFMQFAHGRCLADELEALGAPPSLPAGVRWPPGFRDVHAAARPGADRPTEFDAVAELGGDTPQRSYPLRSVGEFSFQIKLNESTESLGEMTQAQALREAYPGAVYLHLARKYEVKAWHTSAFAPFIRVKPTAPNRSTRPRITTWINASVTRADLIDGHLLKGENGLLAECQMQITERVDGFVDGNGGEHRYQELRQRNPNLRSRTRNFRTSGVVLCIDEPWFRRETSRRRISDSMREVFAREYSVLPQDIGSVATGVSLRGVENIETRGRCVAVFDEVYGSLRLTERLYVEFAHILDRLAAAVEATSDSSDSTEFATVLSHVREVFSTFTGGVSVAEPGLVPEGYEEVFTKGSRVCARQKGQIAEDVVIIQPTLMNGQLMYQVEASPRPGRPPVRRWISASDLEPSGEEWDYATWNRRTEAYEDPPDSES